MWPSCLNPFMNQVYFYALAYWPMDAQGMRSLNPFMNQVYFYCRVKERPAPPSGLNPFMNQVYFYSTSGLML